MPNRDWKLWEISLQVRDLAAMVGIEAGDEMEFDHIGDGTLRLRKA